MNFWYSSFLYRKSLGLPNGVLSTLLTLKQKNVKLSITLCFNDKACLFLVFGPESVVKSAKTHKSRCRLRNVLAIGFRKCMGV